MIVGMLKIINHENAFLKNKMTFGKESVENEAKDECEEKDTCGTFLGILYDTLYLVAINQEEHK